MSLCQKSHSKNLAKVNIRAKLFRATSLSEISDTIGLMRRSFLNVDNVLVQRLSIIVCLLLLLPSCSETSKTVAPTTTVAPDLETVVGRLSQDWDGNWFMGQLPVVAVKADFDLDPVLVGLINMENSPAGSFPEARVAIEAAADWVNSELGGINGRPIELVTCITDFSIEKSQSCAQEMVMAGVVAITTGTVSYTHLTLPTNREV